MPASKAQIKAKDKYNAKTYRQIQTKIKIADYELIDQYCKDNNISKAQLIVKSIKYCMDNGIRFTNDNITPEESQPEE